MDINSQLQPIVAGIIDNLKGSIEEELREQISAEIVAKIANTEFDTVVQTVVEEKIRTRVENFNFAKTSDEELTKILAQLTSQLRQSLFDSASQQINSYITQNLATFDLASVVNSLVQTKLEGMLQTQQFPEQSIHHNSINFTGIKLTGDAITGGIITKFGSTGIEDLASSVQMTLMDQGTAFEGPLFAPAITIKGDVTLDGRLVINGELAADSKGFLKLVQQTSVAVRTLLNTELFSGFSDIVFEKIQTDGIDLDKITQGGKDIVKGNQLGYHIVDSNLRRLGIVNDLQTSGENLLCDTLYVSKGRVGVNTIDPTAALSVWDQEIEVTINKHSQDTGYVGTPRAQRLVLGANGKQNIVLEADGSVEVDNLRIGNVPMTSGATVPNYVGIAGTIVWNESPMPGSAIGWVCLGATQWASFGKVE